MCHFAVDSIWYAADCLVEDTTFPSMDCFGIAALPSLLHISGLCLPGYRDDKQCLQVPTLISSTFCRHFAV